MIAAAARFLGLNTLLAYALIALIGVGSIWGYGAIKYRAGKADGISIERMAWEQARAKLLRQFEAERKAAQAEIDRIEGEYILRRDNDLAAIQSLENTLAQMEAENAQDAGACRCGLPRRLRDKLAPIGR